MKHNLTSAARPLAKRLLSVLSTLLPLCLFLAPRALAASTQTGGNAIMDSTIFTGIQKMLGDASIALMIIAPILGGLLIGLFSMLGAMQAEEHEKQKWHKCRKTTLTAMIFVFASGGIMGILSFYFKG